MRLERNTLAAISSIGTQRMIAFVGSGPLPLTFLSLIELQKEPLPLEASCLNIDRDCEAIQLSRSVCVALGQSQIGHSRADVGIEDEVDMMAFDVVFFGAMLGEMVAKVSELLLRVARGVRPGAIIVVRSSSGFKSLLSPVTDIHGRILRGMLTRR